MIASAVAVALFPGLRRNPVAVLGQGADDASMPLLNTAAVIGFGGVVTVLIPLSCIALLSEV